MKSNISEKDIKWEDVPTVAADVMIVVVRELGRDVDFIAAVNTSFDDNLKLTVVSAVRLSGGIESLKNLKSNIEKQIKAIESREQ